MRFAAEPALQPSALSRLPGSANVVFDEKSAGLRVQTMRAQLQRKAGTGGREERNASSQDHGNDRHFNTVDEPRASEFSKQLATAPQPQRLGVAGFFEAPHVRNGIPDERHTITFAFGQAA